MRVGFAPNYFDPLRVQEACERYVFFLVAKLRELRSRGWEAKVGSSVMTCVYMCTSLQHILYPDSLQACVFTMSLNQFMGVTRDHLNGFSSTSREREFRDLWLTNHVWDGSATVRPVLSLTYEYVYSVSDTGKAGTSIFVKELHNTFKLWHCRRSHDHIRSKIGHLCGNAGK